MESSILASCTSGGCGAKLAPGVLADVLAKIPPFPAPGLLVGYDASDDGAVYALDHDRCLVSTADFFSPMVDDPRTFGRIAAANALSDVYAMGGTPILALNLVCFPEKMDLDVLAEILAGGAEKTAEAGAALGGGHSIYDKEPKYGLSVTGLVERKRLLRNNTPRPGDSLILTKPLGVGIILAAARGGAASGAAVETAVACMERLNRYAAEKLLGYDVGACTDITGFGFLNHGLEMAGNAVTLRIFPDALPYIPEARAYAEEYLVTAAGQRNRNHAVRLAGQVAGLPFGLQELLFDPQTSGGLLISVEQAQAASLLRKIQADDPAAAIIGSVLSRKESPLEFG